jgi:hypothetical protein
MECLSQNGLSGIQGLIQTLKDSVAAAKICILRVKQGDKWPGIDQYHAVFRLFFSLVLIASFACLAGAML